MPALKLQGMKRVKARLIISARTSTKGLQIEGQKIGVEILEELKEFKVLKKKLVTFMEYQRWWNTFMQGKYEANQISISSVPIFKSSIYVGTSRVVAKEKNKEKSDVEN